MERRAGRACETCYWFEPRTDSQRQSFWPYEGKCCWREPASVRTFGEEYKRAIKYANQEWCSCWEPHMGRM